MREPFLIHHYLERAALEMGERVAVVDGDRSVSYEELLRLSGVVASNLADLGVQQRDRVGIYMAKSLEAVAAIYGVLRAGAVYVPMDPGAPVARLGYMAANCEMSVVLTSPDREPFWDDLVAASGRTIERLVVMGAAARAQAGGSHIVHIDDHRGGDDWTGGEVIEDDLAYILYTSGSTGEPKGVMLTHENCRSFVQWAVEEFAVDEDDRLSSHAPFHFDLSTFDLFAASAAGATLVLVPPKISVFPIEVARFIEDNAITVWYSVPSILTLMTEHAGIEQGAFASLRTILFAGEVFPTKYLARLMRLLPQVDFVNLYGPTETNVCTWFRVPSAPDESAPPVSIGGPIRNVETFVVGAEGEEVEPGKRGELYVRGPTVMKGYWGDEERTRERLVTSPLPRHLGDKAYRTGDLVEEMEGGDYRFLGRRDDQVKSRGYRIELGDIESAVSRHPAVMECGVVAIPDEMISNRLECFVSTTGLVESSELKAFCAEVLPRYMIPERFWVIDALPKTSTGKIDRQSLLAEAAGVR